MDLFMRKPGITMKQSEFDLRILHIVLLENHALYVVSNFNVHVSRFTGN